MTAKMRILIVDDDPKLRRTLSDILRAKGYVPTAVGTGTEALSSVEDDTPSIALIDLRLEDLPGLELVRQIRARSPITECIVLTGHASQSSAIEAINLGAYSYVQKPYDIEQLLVTIRRAVEKHEAEVALQESELRFRSTFEQAAVGIVHASPSGRFLRINRRFCDIVGYTQDELPVLCFQDITHPDDMDADLENMRRTLVGERETFSMEKRYIRKDGSSVWVNLTTSLVREPSGEPKYFIGVIEDIGERKRAEAERQYLLTQIQEQAHQVQQIIDTVPEGVLLMNADGVGGWRVVLTNPVAEGDLEALAGAKVGDTITHLAGRPVAELLAPPPRGMWHQVETDGPSSRVFEVIARPIETGPTYGGWVLVVRDVTQEREIQQRVQQQERLAAVGQLAAGIAHDFNNIMATIVLYAEMMSRTPDLSTRNGERLATIGQQAKHATDLIQQILDFSRRSVLELQPLDLGSLLREQVRLLERTLPESIKVSISFGAFRNGVESVDGLDEYAIKGDSTRIQQVVVNLALNARDAMPDGGDLHVGLERIRVKPGDQAPIHEMEDGDWVRMTVRDTGMGIPPDVRPHIFEPFFTTKPPGQGSGLGLPQVHGIVMQHGGHILVESHVRPRAAQRRGTQFTVYLPSLLARPAEDLPQELPLLAQGAGETILVVEDNAAARKAVVESLEMLDYRVVAATDGREALAQLERNDIALVLSDVVMPGMGGVALVREMRRRGLETRVVLVTGHPMEREWEDLRAQGVVEWLAKPPSLERLAEVVARVLNPDREKELNDD